MRITAKTIQSDVTRWAKHFDVITTTGPSGYCSFWVPGGRPLLIQFKSPGLKLTESQELEIKRWQDMKYLIMICDHAEEAKAVLAMGLRAAGVEVSYNVGG